MKTNEALGSFSRFKTSVEQATDYIENFDILETINNVGNDEVFTPLKICNQMLDILPKDVWVNPNLKWLNPVDKNGVFLREIALRLDEGLAEWEPNSLKRRKHILKNMLFSIGLTRFTAQVSRRTVYYCIKANKSFDGKLDENHSPINGYAIGNGSWFSDEEGNIITPDAEHSFVKGKCQFCGISQNSKYTDSKQVEHYAYQFIHEFDIQNFLSKRFNKGEAKMKFDIIIGNPPYQLSTAFISDQQNADPIYQLFINQAKVLEPRYLCMIIPSRWMTGGKPQLKEFRKDMLKDKHIKVIHDYADASECFTSVEIKGGVCYFLRDSQYNGPANYYFHKNNNIDSSKRHLDEFDDELFVRDKNAISIIEKVVKSNNFRSFEEIAGSQTPFGIVTTFQDFTEKPTNKNTMLIYGNKDLGYTSPKNILKNSHLAYKFKVFVPKAVGDGNIESDLIKPIVPENPSICTQTYLVFGEFETKKEAENLSKYIKTKFFHFLLGQLKNTQQLPPIVFKFVPIVDFKIAWTDEALYSKYKLTDSEIKYIENSVWSRRKDIL